MAIIYSYPEPAINVGMRLLGSDTTITGNPTININIGSLAEFILAYFNNSGTPNTHAMFITSTTIGDSYINQTAPTATSAVIYSNENHQMTKHLIVDGNLYVQPSADKADLWAKTTSIQGEEYEITTSVSQTYNGTEDHNSKVNFHSYVDFGDLATTNVDQAAFYHKLAVKGNLLDFAGSAGAATQILSSTGTSVGWVDQLASGLEYRGVWNANLNTSVDGPLASGVGTQGYYYIVNVPGATNLDGFNSWQIGDWAVFSSANVWQEIDNSAIFSGAGTPNTMSKWTGVTALGDSQSTDDGVNINITPSGQLDLGGSPIELTSAINEINVNSKIDLLNKVNLIGTTECTGPFVDAFVSQGNVGQVLSSTGVGTVQWIDGSAAAGALSGSGTLNYIPKWTPSGTELSNSVLFDDGTDLTTPIPVAGEIKLLAHNHWYLESKGDGNLATEGELDINNLGSAITDRIRIKTNDALGYDQYIDLWNNNAGLDIDVNLFDVTSTTDLVLTAGAAVKLSGASYLASGGSWVFDNASVQFNEPIIDSVGSTGLASDVLKNDGTGKVTWGAPTWTQEAKIFEVSVTVTAAELLNIAVIDKLLLPALGANLVIQAVAMNVSKAAGVAYDFPADLYAAEKGLTGVPQAKQTILSTYWTNTVSLTNATCNAVASGSWVDGAYRYGLAMMGNEDLVLTQDGLNATVGSGDLTVVVYYRKLDLTTMEYLPS